MRRAADHANALLGKGLAVLILALVSCLAANGAVRAQPTGAPAATAQLSLGCPNDPGARLIGWRVHVAADGPSGIQMICALRNSPVSWDANSLRQGQSWYAPGSREVGWEHRCPAGEVVAGYAVWTRNGYPQVITDITPMCSDPYGGGVHMLPATGLGSGSQTPVPACVWRSDAQLIIAMTSRIQSVFLTCDNTSAGSAPPSYSPNYGAQVPVAPGSPQVYAGSDASNDHPGAPDYFEPQFGNANARIRCDDPSLFVAGWRLDPDMAGPTGITTLCVGIDGAGRWTSDPENGQTWTARAHGTAPLKTYICPPDTVAVGYRDATSMATPQPGNRSVDLAPICRAADGGPETAVPLSGTGYPYVTLTPGRNTYVPEGTSSGCWRRTNLAQGYIELSFDSRAIHIYYYCYGSQPFPLGPDNRPRTYGADQVPQDDGPSGYATGDVPQRNPDGPGRGADRLGSPPAGAPAGSFHYYGLGCGDHTRHQTVGWRIVSGDQGIVSLTSICMRPAGQGLGWVPGSRLDVMTWTSQSATGDDVREYLCQEGAYLVGQVEWRLGEGGVIRDVSPLCRRTAGAPVERVAAVGLGLPREFLTPGCVWNSDVVIFLSTDYDDGPALWVQVRCGYLNPGLGETFGRDQVPDEPVGPDTDRVRTLQDQPGPADETPFEPDRGLDRVTPCARDFRDPASPAPTPTGECIDQEAFTPDRGARVQGHDAPPAPPPVEPAQSYGPGPDVPDCPRANGVILVPANLGWCNSRVKLSGHGSRLTITAQGRWSNSGPPAQGPEGFSGYRHPGTVVADADLASLVARIGGSPGFGVGARFDARNSVEGWVILSINDTPDTFGDNQGYVEVRIQERPE